MKQIYYLLLLVLISLVACENRHIKNSEKDLYFYNALEDNITLEIFKEGEISTYELTPNDSIFWTTLHFSYDDRLIMQQPPRVHQVYINFLYLIDSASVRYNSKIYTYSGDEIHSLNGLFYLQGIGMDIIYFDKSKKEYFGWE